MTRVLLNVRDDSNLVKHARRELELLGEDSDFAESIVLSIAAFSNFGHSGASAAIAVEYLNKLLRYENLTPLTSSAEEWLDRSEISGYPLWQNVRNPAVFSKDSGTTSYTLNGD